MVKNVKVITGINKMERLAIQLISQFDFQFGEFFQKQ